MIFFAEDFLWNGIREFIAHYHGERNHQGLDNRLIAPIERFAKTGTIRRRQRLGGMLNYLSRCGVREQRSRIQYWDITGSVTSPRVLKATLREHAWKHTRQSFSSGRYRSEARRRSTRPWTWRESGRLHPSPP